MNIHAELLRVLAREAKRAGHKREARAYLMGACFLDGTDIDNH